MALLSEVALHTKTILCAFAHPDDESGWASGIAARYQTEGARVVLVMGTRGERGTAGTPPLCSIDELPRVREAEVREAARIAGFDPVHFLDYEDQQLAAADGDEVRRKLVSLIRQYRPAVVVTFDPEGANRHPDHLAMSRYMSDAIAAASDPRWYADDGTPHAVARLLWTPRVMPWDVGVPDLHDRPSVDFVIDTRQWWRRRRDALAAHKTQRRGLDRLFLGRKDLEQLLSVEVLRQGFGPPLHDRPADDVFVGL